MEDLKELKGKVIKIQSKDILIETCIIAEIDPLIGFTLIYSDDNWQQDVSGEIAFCFDVKHDTKKCFKTFSEQFKKGYFDISEIINDIEFCGDREMKEFCPFVETKKPVH